MESEASRILDQLRQKNEQRMQAADLLAQTVAERMQAEQALRAAQRQEADAIKAAKKAGWSDAELAPFGGTSETPRRRTKRAQKARTSDETTTSADPSE